MQTNIHGKKDSRGMGIREDLVEEYEDDVDDRKM